jgi:flagellar basal body-associated protein FliL
MELLKMQKKTMQREKHFAKAEKIKKLTLVEWLIVVISVLSVAAFSYAFWHWLNRSVGGG